MFNQVINFKRTNLKNGMPNMWNTLTGWEIPLKIIKITQDIVEGERVDTETSINTLGVWQPLRDEQLQLKPEGQRSWSWYWLHAKANNDIMSLQTQDLIKYNDKNYKIMSVKDYSLNGYVEFELIRDYQY